MSGQKETKHTSCTSTSIPYYTYKQGYLRIQLKYTTRIASHPIFFGRIRLFGRMRLFGNDGARRIGSERATRVRGSRLRVARIHPRRPWGRVHLERYDDDDDGRVSFVCVRAAAAWKEETETIALDDLVRRCHGGGRASVEADEWCGGGRRGFRRNARSVGRCARAGGFEEDGKCARVGFRASDRTRLARVGGFGEMEARGRVDGETTRMRNARVDERFRCERRETDDGWIDVLTSS